MSIVVYTTSSSASQAVKKQQNAVTSYLQATKIKFLEVDLCQEGKRQEMLQKLPEDLRGDKTKTAAPQMFKGDEYLGNYEAYFDAQEDGQLTSFFKITSDDKRSELREKISNSGEIASVGQENDKNVGNVESNSAEKIEAAELIEAGEKKADGEAAPSCVESGGNDNSQETKDVNSKEGQSPEEDGSQAEQGHKGESSEVEQGHEGEIAEVEQSHKGESNEVEQGHKKESSEAEQGHEGEIAGVEQSQPE